MILDKMNMTLYEKGEEDLLLGIVDEFKYSPIETFDESNKPEYTEVNI
jgi:hypothetical protein